jgi:ferritin-like metal-binding protein YciE
MDEAARLLEPALQEEKQTDELLNKIAMSGMNKKAT